MSKHRTAPAIVALIGVALLASVALDAAREQLPSARGDVIKLNDGRKIVGEVVQTFPDRIKVKLKHGTVTIYRDEIFEIEERKEPAQLHAEELANAKTADDFYELGKQATEWGLDPEKFAKKDFERAIEVDPDHAGAREALGHKKVGGKWLPEDEWRRAEGYVLFEGRWLKKDEADELREKRRDKARERVEKGTAEARAALEGVPWAKAWKVTTPHYNVRSNAGKTDELAREYADFMELLYDKLSSIFRRIPMKDRERRSIYILRNHKEFMEMTLQFNEGVGGFYMPGLYPASGEERVIVAYHGQFGATGDTYGVLAHEGTHQFEHRMMDGGAEAFLTRPIWLIEGLAVLIGDGHRVKGRGRSRKLEIGIPRDRLSNLQRAIRNDTNHTLAELIRIPKPKFGAFEYAHAWGLIYFMLFGKSRHKTPFVHDGKEVDLATAFESFLKDNLAQGAPPEQFEARIGGAAVLAELERQWKEFILGLELEELGKKRGDTYASKELGFKIARPGRKWKFIEEVDLRFGEHVAAENTETTGRVGLISVPNGFGFDADTISERLVFNLNARLDDPQFIARRAFHHKGFDGYAIEYAGTEKKTLDEGQARTNRQRFRRYVIATPTRYYLLTCQSDEAEFDKNVKDFEESFGSFEIYLD